MLALQYLITFGGLVVFGAYTFLLRNVQPALATSYSYVAPIVAVILGAVVVSETVTANSIIAMGIILSGVVLLAWRR